MKMSSRIVLILLASFFYKDTFAQRSYEQMLKLLISEQNEWKWDSSITSLSNICKKGTYLNFNTNPKEVKKRYCNDSGYWKFVVLPWDLILEKKANWYLIIGEIKYRIFIKEYEEYHEMILSYRLNSNNIKNATTTTRYILLK